MNMSGLTVELYLLFFTPFLNGYGCFSLLFGCHLSLLNAVCGFDGSGKVAQPFRKSHRITFMRLPR